MTSILEALRELEEERKRTTHSATVSVADAPPAASASSGMLYPSIAGLAVGILCVGAAAWWAGVGTSPAPAVPVPQPATMTPEEAPHAPAAAIPHAKPSPTGELAWLDRMEAPQAKVASTALHANADGAEPVPRANLPSVAPAAPRTGAPAGDVRLESIRYAAAPEQRSVTLRLDGRQVTLRQGGRASGVEVQLILEDGAYLNRGSEVFFATPGN